MFLHLRIIGAMLLGLAGLHLIFPRYFRWKEDLAPLALINRQIMGVHTFFLALTVGLMGLLCICCTTDLMTTPLGQKLLFALGVFWLARLIVQFAVYSPALWRGKRLETAVHILFSMAWTYFAIVFFLAAIRTL